MSLALHTYWRSSAAFRVRIALNLKGLEYRQIAQHLLRDGGEHRRPAYGAVNPQRLVPTLEDDDFVLGQSLAIIEYLDETRPKPPLLPGTARDRGTIRAMALAVACDIHPLNNLRVLQYLGRELGTDQESTARWYRHWIDEGFEALEHWIARHSTKGRYCYGDSPTLADICLLPQVFNSRRYQMDLSAYPRLAAVSSHLETLPAFAAARPEVQADAEHA
jgi:maleylacetoacetate isomerase